MKKFGIGYPPQNETKTDTNWLTMLPLLQELFAKNRGGGRHAPPNVSHGTCPCQSPEAPPCPCKPPKTPQKAPPIDFYRMHANLVTEIKRQKRIEFNTR